MKKKSTLEVTGFVSWIDSSTAALSGRAKDQKLEGINWSSYEGRQVRIKDRKTGKRFHGSVRIKPVRCGKPNCKKCPHHIYAYARFRDGKKVREKYLGIAR